ncbi:MBOAT family protein [Pseudomonas allii]|uniref:MBOAT family protein n=2 Tax=Pseudomonas allii TaxID=2740531 RepID=A0ACC6LDZ7_9PSED|nr:MBOAT family protein [Pseudomonas allii]MDR9876702.1 MBOAT family protein [Pseudomonas allii]NWN51202.1 MBOAT family protein [Pseudomonas allii]NWN61225.1 MBOAT family protein [Pseudomonas allii]
MDEKEMVFSSVVFIFYFLPFFLLIYYLTGIRNAVLLTASAVFYVWGEGLYLLLLIALLALNYSAGKIIGVAVGQQRKWALGVFVFINLMVLGVFKYSQFFMDVISGAVGGEPPHLNMHLPLGISFFIFQLVSYLVEVYRQTIKPENSIVRLSTYVMMFPHLVAGPIVRYTDIKEELHNRTVGVEKVGLGVQYFIVGLCQKVMIANSVAPAADHLFSLDPTAVTSAVAWIGATAYTLQIYFDFCGYSNMAIGLAFMLGFRFPKNFDYPYSSKSITEFWRRWHMSLSFWFRDYVYIPLGGSRGGEILTIRNLLIVFFVTGLWHGAAWTFIFWGMFHGLFVVLERVFLKRVLEAAPDLLARLYTLLVVMVGWVYFRANSFDQAWVILKAMAGFDGTLQEWQPFMTWMTPETVAALIAGVVLSFPVIPWVCAQLKFTRVNGSTEPGRHGRDAADVHALPAFLLVGGLVCSVVLLASSSLNPFLYFRF